MARTIKQITEQLLTNLSITIPELNNPSNKAVYKLLTDVIATGISQSEQLIDIFNSATSLDAVVSQVVGTRLWFRSALLKFQYSETEPQSLIVNDDGNIEYQNYNAELKIIKVLVINYSNSEVQISVAQDSTENDFGWQKLDDNQISSFTGFVNQIAPVNNLFYTIINQDPDRVYITGNLIYSKTISLNNIKLKLISLFNTYLESAVNSGNFNVYSFISLVNNDADVISFNCSNCFIRAFNLPLIVNSNFNPNLTYLILNNSVLLPQGRMISGYAIGEDTSGYSYPDSITYIQEI